MAWTSPSTRATGDLITASIWNTDIVENIKWLGDPSCAIATAAGTTSAGAWVSTSLTSAFADGLTVDPTQLTVVRAGIYGITFYASAGAGATDRGARIRVNGVAIGTQGPDASGGAYSVSAMAGLAAAQTIEGQFFHASGGGETITGRLAAIWHRDL